MDVLWVVGWGLWGFVAYLAVTFTIGCRQYAASGHTFMWATAIQTLFWWGLAIAFLLGSES